MIIALAILLYLVGGIAAGLVALKFYDPYLPTADLGLVALTWPAVSLFMLGVGVVVGLGRLVERLARFLT